MGTKADFVLFSFLIGLKAVFDNNGEKEHLCLFPDCSTNSSIISPFVGSCFVVYSFCYFEV